MHVVGDPFVLAVVFDEGYSKLPHLIVTLLHLAILEEAMLEILDSRRPQLVTNKEATDLCYFVQGGCVHADVCNAMCYYVIDVTVVCEI
jgi:hypothetical protein